MSPEEEKLRATIDELRLRNAHLEGQIEELRRIVESYQRPLFRIEPQVKETPPVVPLPGTTLIKSPNFPDGTIQCHNQQVVDAGLSLE